MTGNCNCCCCEPAVNQVPPRLEGELNQTIMYVGVAYIPRVVDGYLTWSNDYDLPNPNSVYIKGNDGVGIKSISINENNHLILTLTDDTAQDGGLLDLPKIINESTKDLFPEIGSSNNIYISNEGVFRWDEDTKTYISILSATESAQADWNETDENSPSFIKNKPTSLSDNHFTYDQKSASDTWVIDHNLNKYPSVTIVDSAGNVVTGEVTYNSTNQVTIRFTSAFSGKAYLN